MADRKFLHGEISVLVVTESYELGVDNPNISQIIRIGCPRNLGVFLQEVGHAGRKPNTVVQPKDCYISMNTLMISVWVNG